MLCLHRCFVPHRRDRQFNLPPTQGDRIPWTEYCESLKIPEPAHPAGTVQADRLLEIETSITYDDLRKIVSGAYESDNSKAYTQEMRALVAHSEPSLSSYVGPPAPPEVPSPSSDTTEIPGDRQDDDEEENSWTKEIREIKSSNLPAEKKKAEIARILADFVSILPALTARMNSSQFGPRGLR